jgi:hypothetical protein
MQKTPCRGAIYRDWHRKNGYFAFASAWVCKSKPTNYVMQMRANTSGSPPTLYIFHLVFLHFFGLAGKINAHQVNL